MLPSRFPRTTDPPKGTLDLFILLVKPRRTNPNSKTVVLAPHFIWTNRVCVSRSLVCVSRYRFNKKTVAPVYRFCREFLSQRWPCDFSASDTALLDGWNGRWKEQPAERTVVLVCSAGGGGNRAARISLRRPRRQTGNR